MLCTYLQLLACFFAYFQDFLLESIIATFCLLLTLLYLLPFLLIPCLLVTLLHLLPFLLIPCLVSCLISCKRSSDLVSSFLAPLLSIILAFAFLRSCLLTFKHSCKNDSYFHAFPVAVILSITSFLMLSYTLLPYILFAYLLVSLITGIVSTSLLVFFLLSWSTLAICFLAFLVTYIVAIV